MSNLFTPSEQQERDDRLAGAVTSYGPGTRSYARSPEARESKRQMAETTERYLAQPRQEIAQPLSCTCRSYRFPHPPARHGTLKHPADWTPWQKRYRFNRDMNSWEEK